MELKNIKHEKFAVARFEGKTQKEAAIVAGYSSVAATQQGYRLGQMPEIKERIKELSREYMDKLRVKEHHILKGLEEQLDDPDCPHQVKANIRLTLLKRIDELKEKNMDKEEENIIHELTDEELEEKIKILEGDENDKKTS